MNLCDKTIVLADMLQSSRVLFVRSEPEVPDFTTGSAFKVHVFSANSSVFFEVSPDNASTVAGIFDETIFNKDFVDRVYFWDLKSFCSFFRFCTKSFITPKNLVLDLKPIELFLGMIKNAPTSFVEVLNRVSVVAKNKDWMNIYKSIHLPLSLKTLPSVETTPLLNTISRQSEHPYYEIEGQTNGRLNCSNKFSKCYLPHTMSSTTKENMKPKGYGLIFATADFRFCEVVVLQWLTGDKKLKELLDSGQDLHSQIYEIITQTPCDTDAKRSTSKKMFLPVVYGFGAAGLSKFLGFENPNVGQEIKRRIETVFHESLNWINEKQEIVKSTGLIKDYFGRPRKYSPEESYLCRNFVVQSVAATVCQEKMIELNANLLEIDAKLAFSVHDGYCIVGPSLKGKQIYEITKDTLESESKLCSGLKMRVEIKFGSNLNQMKILWTK